MCAPPGVCRNPPAQEVWRSDLRLIVAGSTLEGEEAALLEAWPQRTRGRSGIWHWFWRRAIRSDSARWPLFSTDPSFQWIRRSEWPSDATGAPRRLEPGEIVLLDTIGELASIYSLASVAFVGGSLIPAGGHNPLEPAQFGVPIVMGPHYANFRAIIEDLLAHQAIRIAPKEELAGELIELLRDSAAAAAMGARARQVFEQQSGATERCVQALSELLAGEVARSARHERSVSGAPASVSPGPGLPAGARGPRAAPALGIGTGAAAALAGHQRGQPFCRRRGQNAACHRPGQIAFTSRLPCGRALPRLRPPEPQPAARVRPEGTAEEFGDEPLLIAREAGVPVYVAPQRYDAGILAGCPRRTKKASLGMTSAKAQHILSAHAGLSPDLPFISSTTASSIANLLAMWTFCSSSRGLARPPASRRQPARAESRCPPRQCNRHSG